MIYADSGLIMRWVEGAIHVRDPIDNGFHIQPENTI